MFIIRLPGVGDISALGSPVGAEYQFGVLCQLPGSEVRAGLDGGTTLLDILNVMDLNQSSTLH